MFQSIVSSLGSKKLFVKNLLYMMIIIYFYKILEKQQHLSSIMNHNVKLMIMKVYEPHQYTSSKNQIYEIFIFIILFDYYSFVINCTSQLIIFGTFGIQISRFVESHKKLSYLGNMSLLFSKKDLKTTINISKITKQKKFTNKTIIL